MPTFAGLDRLPAHLRAQQGYGWHMHDGGYMMGGYWGAGVLIHAVLWLLLTAAGILIALCLVRCIGAGRGKDDGRRSALDQLDERYARGEIDREEYLQRKKDIMER
ncbi:SHOCT domain-containing protein [Novosphingobium album (ex Hu et al. 2023)]|uniref:SHOCT domain-containing protein n=1 Tax=Novosphingobium album (ex Hu et al. 2023) TaxID=2930093 RepID=A0ABT0AYH1_9SPHN|nr:SHOCT domain-containing protein [Novosphingobium album (ex Hu et al. 2023)]MCJ2177847.1 SHOCT domain-containing protein [Novosphingobium album (ex Hu et al. 2023)]